MIGKPVNMPSVKIFNHADSDDNYYAMMENNHLYKGTTLLFEKSCSFLNTIVKYFMK